MHLNAVRLQNFRSYGDGSFEFEKGVNIIVGPNASGKTNLLEAILVLASGKSYRAKDAELVKLGRDWARLDGYFDNHTRSVKLEPAKSYILDDKPAGRLSFEKTLPTVLFEPNHLQLVSRGPEYRRDYIDDILERSRQDFKSLAASYKRTLTQRNSLLKQGPRRAKTQLFAWNIRLAELGSKIARARQELVDDINRQISHTYSHLAGKKSRVELEYASQFPVENYSSRMLDKLEKNVDLDFDRGFTAVGPHREDIIFHLNRHPSGSTASRGEGRSLLLALKLYELHIIEKIRAARPILLLDDVFSELDGSRRHALVEHLNGHQVIITTTDADSVINNFLTNYKAIALSR